MTEKKVCPECGSTRIKYDRKKGEWVCLDCGYVFDEPVVDMGPEWRALIATRWRRGPGQGPP